MTGGDFAQYAGAVLDRTGAEMGTREQTSAPRSGDSTYRADEQARDERDVREREAAIARLFGPPSSGERRRPTAMAATSALLMAHHGAAAARLPRSAPTVGGPLSVAPPHEAAHALAEVAPGAGAARAGAEAPAAGVVAPGGSRLCLGRGWGWGSAGVWGAGARAGGDAATSACDRRRRRRAGIVRRRCRVPRARAPRHPSRLRLQRRAARPEAADGRWSRHPSSSPWPSRSAGW